MSSHFGQLTLEGGRSPVFLWKGENNIELPQGFWKSNDQYKIY
jgi:hypothetical protein